MERAAPNLRPLPQSRGTRADIARLRELHVEMDLAVAAAYGWGDLDLDHDLHETPQGVRFTISEAARREVLTRLLRLNHERYEDEMRQGLHEKKGNRSKRSTGKKAAKKKTDDRQMSLF
jgi:DNA-binding GntR family transcriptional regulator